MNVKMRRSVLIVWSVTFNYPTFAPFAHTSDKTGLIKKFFIINLVK